MLLLKETKLNSHFTQHKDFMLCCGRIRVYVVLWSHQSLCCVVVHQSLCCVVVASEFMLCCGRIRVYVVLWSHQSLCCAVVASEFMLCCGHIRVYVVLWSHQSLFGRIISLKTSIFITFTPFWKTNLHLPLLSLNAFF